VSAPKVKRRSLPARTILYVADHAGGIQGQYSGNEWADNALCLWHVEKRFAEMPQSWSIIHVAEPRMAISVLESMPSISHVLLAYGGHPPSTIGAWVEKMTVARPHVAIIGLWLSGSWTCNPDALRRLGIDAHLPIDEVEIEDLVRVVEVDTMTAGRRRVENLTARVRQLQEELVLLDAALERAEVTQPPTVSLDLEAKVQHA
jgi:hypothetical protein